MFSVRVGFQSAQKLARAAVAARSTLAPRCRTTRYASSASSTTTRTPQMTQMQWAQMLLTAAYPQLQQHPHVLNAAQVLETAVATKRQVHKMTAAQRSHLILRIANAIMEQSDEILMANREDIAHADQIGLDAMTCTKLVLSQAKLKALADQLVAMADAPLPTGHFLPKAVSALVKFQETVAEGVDLVAFDAQSDVLPQLVAMAIQSGNALILDGATEAYGTNRALLTCINAAIQPEVTSPFQLIRLREDVPMVAAAPILPKIPAVIPSAELSNLNLRKLTAAQRSSLLVRIAKALTQQTEEILMANREDLAHADLIGLDAVSCTKLVLSQAKVKALADRIASMATTPMSAEAACSAIKDLVDCHETIGDGIDLVTFGVRANALPQLVALGIQAGTALVLEGSPEAYHTNRCLHNCIAMAVESELGSNAFQFVRLRGDAAVRPIIQMPTGMMPSDRVEAARSLRALTPEQRSTALLRISKALMDREEEIVMANREDIAYADRIGLSPEICAEMVMSQAKIKDLTDQIAAMSMNLMSPIAIESAMKKLVAYRETLAEGVDMVAFDARSDVLPQLIALAIQSGTALVLQGALEAYSTNRALLTCIVEAIQPEINANAFQLKRPREDVLPLMPSQKSGPSMKERVQAIQQDVTSRMSLTAAQRSHLLLRIAMALSEQTDDILMANHEDIAHADLVGLDPMACDQLVLSHAKMTALVNDIKAMATAPMPTTANRTLPSMVKSLVVSQDTIVNGIDKVVMDTRTDVLPKVVAMAIQSGTALILEGAAEAYSTNRAMLACILSAVQPDMSANAFQLLRPREDASM